LCAILPFDRHERIWRYWTLLAPWGGFGFQDENPRRPSQRRANCYVKDGGDLTALLCCNTTRKSRNPQKIKR
jgi:hypothetical protein